MEAAPAQESLGARLKRLRLERGMSQRELSGPGVSYAYVSRIEGGQRDPSLKALRILAKKLRVPLEHLETGAPIPSAYSRDIALSDAELALRLGKESENSAQTFRRLLLEAHEDADENAASRARMGLGLALAERGEYREAISHLEKATADAAVTPSARPDVYAALGRCYASTGQGEHAVALFGDVLTMLDEGDTALHVRFTSYLSCALADEGDLRRAREVLVEIAESAGEDLDPHNRVLIYWSLARADSMAGRAVAAMAEMRRALSLLEASEDTLELARAHLHCAEILILEGQVEEAGSHIDRADRLFELGADHRDLGALRTQQARRAVLREEADGAVLLAQEALGYLAEHVIDQGSAYHALGLAQALKGDLDAAAASFERAAEQLEQGGEWREALAVYTAWAKALREAHREPEALDVMERATMLTVRNLSARA